MRANQRPPKRKQPPAIPRIKVGKQPLCSRCGRHASITGRSVCVSCRDMVSSVNQPLPSQIIPIPRGGTRSRGFREDVQQTKFGEEMT